MMAVDLYMVLIEISEANNDLKVTISESVKGAGVMGGSTFTGAVAGGMIGGPLGMIAGGALGFIGGAGYAAANTKSFKPLHEVLSEMNEQDKKRLVAAAIRVIERRGINVAVQIVGRYGTTFAKEFLQTVYSEFAKA